MANSFACQGGGSNVVDGCLPELLRDIGGIGVPGQVVRHGVDLVVFDVRDDRDVLLGHVLGRILYTHDTRITGAAGPLPGPTGPLLAG